MRVKRSKCKFMTDNVEYLGHIGDSEGLHPTEEKVKAIVNATNVTELRSFLGPLNYYGRFMKNLSMQLRPLHELLKRESVWKWTSECEAVFKSAKDHLLQSTIVVHYDTKKPLKLPVILRLMLSVLSSPM